MLILTLLIAMTLGMTIAVTSDTLITRYYRNFRSSFYAADSGTNVVRQYMANQLVASIPATFSNTAQPIPSTEAATVQTNILSNYGSSATASNLLITQGNAANSWKGSFYIASSPGPALTLTSCHAPLYRHADQRRDHIPARTSRPALSCAAAAFNLYEFQYVYNYAYTSMGQSLASEQAQVTGRRHDQHQCQRSPRSRSNDELRRLGHVYRHLPDLQRKHPLVGGTISGPPYSPMAPGTSARRVTPSPIRSGARAPISDTNSATSAIRRQPRPDSQSGATIAPTFQSGYKLGQNAHCPCRPIPTARNGQY